MSSQFGFKAFTEEVKQRKERKKRNRLFSLSILVLICIVVTGFNNNKNTPNKQKQPLEKPDLIVPAENNFELVAQELNQEAIITNLLAQSVSPQSIQIPETSVLSGANLFLSDTDYQLRIFLRQPAKDEASLPCGATPKHFWIQILNYNTEQEVGTAFIRAQDVIQLALPNGLYKIRFTSGNEWYGEKTLFNEEFIYEFTEKGFPDKAQKVDLAPGARVDIGISCSRGNLATKRISRDEAIQP